MNELEVAKLLTIASMIDNRNVPPEVVREWTRILGDIEFDIGREAVERHFMSSAEYLMPSHVVAGAGLIERERRKAEYEIEGDPPAGFRWPPKPDNLEAMSAAHKDPVAFAREVHRYNEQLVAAGFPTVEEDRRARLGR